MNSIDRISGGRASSRAGARTSRSHAWFKCCALLTLVLMFAGCVSGSKLLGTVTLKDGTTLEHVQIITEGQDGPKLAVVETYRYDPGKNTSLKEGAYQAAGSSLTAEVLRGAASAVILGGSLMGAAALVRPDQTHVTQTGGGASISNSGNSSASAGGGGVSAAGSICTGSSSASNSGSSVTGTVNTVGGPVANNC